MKKILLSLVFLGLVSSTHAVIFRVYNSTEVWIESGTTTFNVDENFYEDIDLELKDDQTVYEVKVNLMKKIVFVGYNQLSAWNKLNRTGKYLLLSKELLFMSHEKFMPYDYACVIKCFLGDEELDTNHLVSDYDFTQYDFVSVKNVPLQDALNQWR